MGWKSFIVIILIGVFLKKAFDTYIKLQLNKVVYNHSPGPCKTVKNIENGSEDIQFVPNTRLVLISSGVKVPNMVQNPRMASAPGQFYLFDFEHPEDGANVVPCTGLKTYGTSQFAPHGISVFKHQGKIYLFTVNHPLVTSDVVEKFEFDLKTHTLKYLHSYKSDLYNSINDVVAIGPDSFYVSNLYYFRDSRLQFFEIPIAQLEWSYFVYQEGDKSYIADEGFSLANGVNASPDKRYIYLYTGLDSMLRVYEKELKNGQISHKLVQMKHLAESICDNIDVELDSGHLWLGCHPIAHKTLNYMGASNDEERPIAPSQVLRIKTKDGLLTEDIQEVYMNDGSDFQVSTVAVYDKKSSAMLVGSIDRTLLYCEIKYL